MIRRAPRVATRLWRVLAMMKMTKERRLMILTLTHPLGGRAVAWIATRRILTPLDPVVKLAFLQVHVHGDIEFVRFSHL